MSTYFVLLYSTNIWTVLPSRCAIVPKFVAIDNLIIWVRTLHRIINCEPNVTSETGALNMWRICRMMFAHIWVSKHSPHLIQLWVMNPVWPLATTISCRYCLYQSWNNPITSHMEQWIHFPLFPQMECSRRVHTHHMVSAYVDPTWVKIHMRGKTSCIHFIITI